MLNLSHLLWISIFLARSPTSKTMWVMGWSFSGIPLSTVYLFIFRKMVELFFSDIRAFIRNFWCDKRSPDVKPFDENLQLGQRTLHDFYPKDEVKQHKTVSRTVGEEVYSFIF